jgi:phosphoribosyl 1,2-cyclic phosphodiesterase
MKLLPVASSSAGNCTMIYDDDTHILIDCGVSTKKVLEITGRSTFDALFISHEHGDHMSSAGPLGRKTKVPIYVHPLIQEAKADKFKNCDLKDLNETMTITIGSFQITPFSTKHDAIHSMGFIVYEPSTGTKLCYLTDTGNISKTMRAQMIQCNAFFIEADYDDELIVEYDGYDQLLKDRITSDFGHLSTNQLIEFLSSLDFAQVKLVIVGHLSARTNSPEKIKERFHEKLAAYESKILVAPFEGHIDL